MKTELQEVRLFKSTQLQIDLLNKYLNTGKAEIVSMPEDFQEVITRKCPDFRIENGEYIRPYWERCKIDTPYTSIDIDYIEEDCITRLEHDLEIIIQNLANKLLGRFNDSLDYFLTVIISDSGLFSTYTDEIDTFHIAGNCSYSVTYRHFITHPIKG